MMGKIFEIDNLSRIGSLPFVEQHGALLWQRIPSNQEQDTQFGRAQSQQATLYTMLLPLRSNYGEPIPADLIEWVKGEILGYAGGLTTHAPGTGLWVNEQGVLFQDDVLPLFALITRSAEGDLWFTQLTAKVATLLDQEAVLVFAQEVRLLKLVVVEEKAETASK